MDIINSRSQWYPRARVLINFFTFSSDTIRNNWYYSQHYCSAHFIFWKRVWMVSVPEWNWSKYCHCFIAYSVKLFYRRESVLIPVQFQYQDYIYNSMCSFSIKKLAYHCCIFCYIIFIVFFFSKKSLIFYKYHITWKLIQIFCSV